MPWWTVPLLELFHKAAGRQQWEDRRAIKDPDNDFDEEEALLGYVSGVMDSAPVNACVATAPGPE